MWRVRGAVLQAFSLSALSPWWGKDRQLAGPGCPMCPVWPRENHQQMPSARHCYPLNPLLPQHGERWASP